ncbi:MAG: glycosyltransferase [Acetobacteraceae bacterium]|nr:glycosyltransferase [Acetobacteraceae bacterium]
MAEAVAVAGQVARERRRADAANARAERERERARRATERALAAEARLAEFEASAAWRLTWPARRLAYAVPKPLYTIVRNAPGRLLRAVRGGPSERRPAPPTPAPAQPEPGRGPAALLVDDHWPRPDRDAGSIEISNLAEALMGFGFEVWFAADRDHAADVGGGSSGRDALTAKGVRCLRPADAPSVGAFLEREGGRFALVVLNRVYCGGRFLEDAQRHCTGARIVFNTIDLHYLRLQREAELRGDADGLAAAAAVREREEVLAREADVTVVVSDAERDLLAASVPGANIVVLPLAREVRPPRTPYAGRSGVGFIGGFAHAPNLDAVCFFLAEVWPLVLRGNPRCEFSIVGAGLPTGVLDRAPGAVRYLGHVADAAPWFESLRLTVAPLRFGAGVKGKVVSSLAAGVPCVATPVAVEGMGLRDGDGGVLVAATSEALADRVLRAHDDPGVWAELSEGGLAHVAARFSPADWRTTLEETLWVMDALPGASAARRACAAG